MSEAKNVDDILIQSMNETSIQSQIESKPNQETSQQENNPEPEKIADDPYVESTEQNENEQHQIDNKSEIQEPIDDYGNPVEKPKMYTQEEVNQIMRDRAARERYRNENQITSQIPVDQQEKDPVTEDDWRKELKHEIKIGVEELKKEEAEKAWRQEQIRQQAEFEDKFTNGMEKYSDFHSVVSGKKITDRMLLATRSLDNPAAFVYAAAKLHSKELERISNINDPYIQASEIGRLHERMVRERKSAANTGKPLDLPKSDLPPVKISNKPSIDERINQYGKSKRK